MCQKHKQTHPAVSFAATRMEPSLSLERPTSDRSNSDRSSDDIRPGDERAAASRIARRTHRRRIVPIKKDGVKLVASDR